MPIDPLHAIQSPSKPTVERGYESSNVSLKLFASLWIGFVVLGCLIGGGVWGVYTHFVRRTALGDERNSIIQGMDSQRGGIPLQPQEGHDMTDAQDLRAMHEHEDAVFDQLGWHWDDKTRTRDVPAAVIAAIKAMPHHPSAATQPAGIQPKTNGES